ncbi:hypothetical protein E2C01_027494 [Portunus trituberculatus]|uniref:Uncharacterized protein n=1 Tax=Portunus trituberculatus TaxID=210409 RepID=A0A5B7EKZ9_PORTR|nr:hypothetical protein [Portunus trituberculatus]
MYRSVDKLVVCNTGDEVYQAAGELSVKFEMSRTQGTKSEARYSTVGVPTQGLDCLFTATLP